MVNVAVEARNDVDNPGVVKLQGEMWELNVWATTDELWKLADIEKTDWVTAHTPSRYLRPRASLVARTRRHGVHRRGSRRCDLGYGRHRSARCCP